MIRLHLFTFFSVTQKYDSPYGWTQFSSPPVLLFFLFSSLVHPIEELGLWSTLNICLLLSSWVTQQFSRLPQHPTHLYLPPANNIACVHLLFSFPYWTRAPECLFCVFVCLFSESNLVTGKQKVLTLTLFITFDFVSNSYYPVLFIQIIKYLW